MNSQKIPDRSELAEQQAARANREAFDAAGVTVISIIGPAGSGKTSVIEELMLRLAPPLRIAVMMCDAAADRHIAKICRYGYPAVAINTNRANALGIRDALPRVDLSGLDFLLIEADGNSIDSGEFNLGEHLRVAVFSAAGGDDKANDFPILVSHSDLILLTKIDLLPFVTFDLQAFALDIKRINSNLSILCVSVHSGEGIKDWLEWMEAHRLANCARCRADRILHPVVSWSRSTDGSTTKSAL